MTVIKGSLIPTSCFWSSNLSIRDSFEVNISVINLSQFLSDSVWQTLFIVTLFPLTPLKGSTNTTSSLVYKILLILIDKIPMSHFLGSYMVFSISTHLIASARCKQNPCFILSCSPILHLVKVVVVVAVHYLQTNSFPHLFFPCNLGLVLNHNFFEGVGRDNVEFEVYLENRYCPLSNLMDGAHAVLVSMSSSQIRVTIYYVVH